MPFESVPPASDGPSSWRVWWIYLALVAAIYGIPVLVGSSWLPTPRDFPARNDNSRQPFTHTAYDTYSFGHFDLPYRELAKSELASGRLPLWNSNSWLGLPSAAQYQNQTFHPLEWLDWIGGSRWWNLTLLLRIAAGGFGCFLLLRNLGVSYETGFGAGASYLFSGYFIGFGSVPGFLNGALLLPWLFLSIHAAFHARSHCIAVAGSAAAFGLALTSGQPQLTFLHLAGSTLFGIGAFGTANTWRHRGIGVARLAAAAVLAIAIASPQLASFREGLAEGYTIHPPGSYGNAATGPLNFIAPLMPMLQGGFLSPWRADIYPSQLNHEAFPVLMGIGMLTAILWGLIGLFAKDTTPTWRVRSLLIATLVPGVVVLGVVITATFDWVNVWTHPWVNRINIPRYGGPMVALTLCSLTGIGLAHLPKSSQLLRWAGLGLSFVAGCWVWFYMERLAREAPAPIVDTLWFLSRWKAGVPALMAWLGLAFVAVRAKRESAQIWIVAATGVVVVELSRLPQFGFEPRAEAWHIGAGLVLALAPIAFALKWPRSALGVAVAAIAMIVVNSMTSERYLERAWNPYEHPNQFVSFFQTHLGKNSAGGRVLGSRHIMGPNLLAGAGIAQLNAVNPLQPLSTADLFLSRLTDKSLNYTLPVAWYGMADESSFIGWQDYDAKRDIFNFLGVKYLIESSAQEVSTLGLQGVDLVLDTPSYRILEDMEAFPRAFLLQSPETTTGSAKEFTLGENAVQMFAEQVPALVPTPEADWTVRSVSQIDYTPTRVRLSVSALTPGWLVLTDVNYPGWRATVDGETEVVQSVWNVMRTLWIPPGVHVVEFVYHPDWKQPSLWAMAIGWTAVFGLIAWATARNRWFEQPSIDG